jgi:hypothetical protein
MKKLLYLFTFLIFLFPSCKQKKNTGIEGNNNTGNNVTIGDNNVIIADNKHRSVSQIDITGYWDKEIAKNIVMKFLNDDKDSMKDEYEHTFVDFYNMNDEDRESMIGVSYSLKKGNDCHTCGAEMSFIEFVKYQNGWKVEQKYLRALSIGTWGNPPEDWKLLNIGYHKFGFIITDSYSFRGNFDTDIYIYSWIAEEFKEILNYSSVHNDSEDVEKGKTNFETEFETVKSGTGFYDLKIRKKGKENGKDFSKSLYYKFNGIKYVESNNFK